MNKLSLGKKQLLLYIIYLKCGKLYTIYIFSYPSFNLLVCKRNSSDVLISQSISANKTLLWVQIVFFLNKDLVICNTTINYYN